MRYAFFPQARRLLVEDGGKLSTYDSGDHQITGVSQTQSQGRSLAFTSDNGPVDLTNPVVRFVHDDPAEADRWLNRVRSAMARARNSPPAHPGVARVSDHSIAPKFDHLP